MRDFKLFREILRPTFQAKISFLTTALYSILRFARNGDSRLYNPTENVLADRNLMLIQLVVLYNNQTVSNFILWHGPLKVVVFLKKLQEL